MVWRTNFDRFLEGSDGNGMRTSQAWGEPAPAPPLAVPPSTRPHARTRQPQRPPQPQLQPTTASREAPQIDLPASAAFPPPPTDAEAEFAAAGFADDIGGGAAPDAGGGSAQYTGMETEQYSGEEAAPYTGAGTTLRSFRQSPGPAPPPGAATLPTWRQSAWGDELEDAAGGAARPAADWDTAGGALEVVVSQLDILAQTMSLLEQRLSVAEEKGSSMEHILAQVCGTHSLPPPSLPVVDSPCTYPTTSTRCPCPPPPSHPDWSKGSAWQRRRALPWNTSGRRSAIPFCPKPPSSPFPHPSPRISLATTTRPAIPSTAPVSQPPHTRISPLTSQSSPAISRPAGAR
jgi:hypothetical protein